MESWRRLLFESQEQLKQTGLPKKLIRHLIFSHHLGAGSRVLDAGCGTGELVRYFALLGLEAAGFDESPEVIATAHDAAPLLDFYCGKESLNIPCPEATFDLVIARNLQSYCESLFSRTALRTTAGLLSCVRPGGELVILPQWTSSLEQNDSVHELSCYEQQLKCFGGPCCLARIGSSKAQNTIQKLFGGRSTTEYATVSLRIPEKQISRADWLRTADRVSNDHEENCCSTATASPGDYGEKRAAA